MYVTGEPQGVIGQIQGTHSQRCVKAPLDVLELLNAKRASSQSKWPSVKKHWLAAGVSTMVLGAGDGGAMVESGEKQQLYLLHMLNTTCCTHCTHCALHGAHAAHAAHVAHSARAVHTVHASHSAYRQPAVSLLGLKFIM